MYVGYGNNQRISQHASEAEAQAARDAYEAEFLRMRREAGVEANIY
jgi:hypothetical protein